MGCKVSCIVNVVFDVVGGTDCCFRVHNRLVGVAVAFVVDVICCAECLVIVVVFLGRKVSCIVNAVFHVGGRVGCCFRAYNQLVEVFVVVVIEIILGVKIVVVIVGGFTFEDGFVGFCVYGLIVLDVWVGTNLCI